LCNIQLACQLGPNVALAMRYFPFASSGCPPFAQSFSAVAALGNPIASFTHHTPPWLSGRAHVYGLRCAPQPWSQQPWRERGPPFCPQSASSSRRAAGSRTASWCALPPWTGCLSAFACCVVRSAQPASQLPRAGAQLQAPEPLALGSASAGSSCPHPLLTPAAAAPLRWPTHSPQTHPATQPPTQPSAHMHSDTMLCVRCMPHAAESRGLA